jgi:hypothetical protein
MELTRDVQTGDKHFFTNHSAGSHLLKPGDVMMLGIEYGTPNQEVVKGEIVFISPTEIHWRIA